MGATILVNFSSHLIHSYAALSIDTSQHPPASDDHHHTHLFNIVSVGPVPSSTISAYLLKHNHVSRRTCRALPSHLHLRPRSSARSSSMTSGVIFYTANGALASATRSLNASAYLSEPGPFRLTLRTRSVLNSFVTAPGRG